MSLLDKIRKNSTVKETSILANSTFFNKKDMIQTPIPAINIALAGSLDGGFTPGLTQWVGPSKHFKTNFSLIMAKSYMDKYPDSILLFYDSEFGTPQSYFNSFGIDTNRVVHTPITDVEQLKFDIMNQIKEITRDDKVIIMVDSIGNLASKKEVEDAIDGKSVADLSRAKQLKSLFRMVTPHLTLKNIPMVVVNHSYKEMSLFPKDIVGGGCLVEGTKVIMADGTKREIELVQVDDLVQTLDGPKSVTHTWNPETLIDGTPECIQITFEDGYTCTVSEGHPFLVNGKWVKASDLTEEMEVTQIPL